MTDCLSRRRFLEATLAVLAWPAISKAGSYVEPVQPEELVALAARSMWPTPDAWRAALTLGQQVDNERRHQEDWCKTASRLEATLPRPAPGETSAEYRQRLCRKIQSDFRNNQIDRHQGWILSRTEIDLYQAAYRTQTKASHRQPVRITAAKH